MLATNVLYGPVSFAYWIVTCCSPIIGPSVPIRFQRDPNARGSSLSLNCSNLAISALRSIGSNGASPADKALPVELQGVIRTNGIKNAWSSGSSNCAKFKTTVGARYPCFAVWFWPVVVVISTVRPSSSCKSVIIKS